MTAPTHTGLGERSHLLTKLITMAMFVEDVVNHLIWEDLTDVVLADPVYDPDNEILRA